MNFAGGSMRVSSSSEEGTYIADFIARVGAARTLAFVFSLPLGPSAFFDAVFFGFLTVAAVPMLTSSSSSSRTCCFPSSSRAISVPAL